MQFLVTLAVALAAGLVPSSAASPVVEARQTSMCGKQPYKKTDYTCYPKNGNALCPITVSNRVALLPCGSGPTLACYDPGNYYCVDGKLELLLNCAGIPFDFNSYVCVQGRLCPKTDPLRCGDACYHLNRYFCSNGILKQQPPV